MTRKVSLDKLGAFIVARTKAQTESAVKAVRTTVATVGLRLIQDAISQARPLPVDRGTYRRSWRAQNIPYGAKLVNPTAQAAVIEHGRRPGARMPPAAQLGEWARRKGLLKGVGKADRPAAQRAIGFVIARAIARRGMPARGLLKGIIPALTREVRAAVHAALLAA